MSKVAFDQIILSSQTHSAPQKEGVKEYFFCQNNFIPGEEILLQLPSMKCTSAVHL